MPLEPLGQAFEPLAARVLTEISAAILPENAPPEGHEGVAQRLAVFLDQVVEWNQRTDLTAARSPEELVDLFVADAALLAALEDGGHWVDVGTGAGAPGLVVALLRSNLRLSLVEPKDRRVAFLRSMIGKFSLPHVSVERGRSDRLPSRGWDVAVSRATLPPPEWLREGERLARRAIWVLLAKDEAPARHGLRVDRDVRYQWPLTGAARRAVRYVPEADLPR